MSEEEIKEHTRSRTERFATWLMERETKRQDKESNLEGLVKLNVFLSIGILVATAGNTITQYLLMAWTWL